MATSTRTVVAVACGSPRVISRGFARFHVPDRICLLAAASVGLGCYFSYQADVAERSPGEGEEATAHDTAPGDARTDVPAFDDAPDVAEGRDEGASDLLLDGEHVPDGTEADGDEYVDPDVEVAVDTTDDVDASDDDGGAVSCPWTGEYVEDESGTCWLERDGRRVDDAPAECCRYRLCNWACGPCISRSECGERIWLWPWSPWCDCSTAGPPDPEVDRFVCDRPVGHCCGVTAAVEHPWEDNREVYAVVADRYCSHWWQGFDNGDAWPGEDALLVDFYPGPCPWQVVRDLLRSPGVHRAWVEPFGTGLFPTEPCP